MAYLLLSLADPGSLIRTAAAALQTNKAVANVNPRRMLMLLCDENRIFRSLTNQKLVTEKDWRAVGAYMMFEPAAGVAIK